MFTVSEWDFCSSALPLITPHDSEKGCFIFACSCFRAVTRLLWYCHREANVMTSALYIPSEDREVCMVFTSSKEEDTDQNAVIRVFLC